MKIGIDIRLIGKKRTGDEVVFLNLVQQFAKLDSENEYVLFTGVQDAAVLEEIQTKLGIAGKRNFSLVNLGAKNKFIWNLWTLPRYLRKNPLDIYHTQYITPWFVPKRTKIVTIIHDVSFAVFPEYIHMLDRVLLGFFIPISLRRADMIVAVSEFTRREIVDRFHVAPEKITVVYNAVAEEFQARPSEEKIAAVRSKYSLPEKYVLYVGTLQPRKNLATLVKAWGMITGKLANVALVVAGKTDAHNVDQDIFAAAKELSGQQVLFPGYIDDADKVALYAGAHAFVLPSRYEGFGIPVLEAMSQRVPVVASNIGSLTEVGASGALYFDLDNLDSLAEKMYTVCVDTDVREKLIQSGIERVSFFSWQKSAEKVLAIYNKMFSNN